ncbi:uncharacterized protein EAF02_010436 [Botrytis sinoallii]|uniref:uncharacterized protein n=1 Tax=Botrytis sinoallii TaxID=1463999 RepID=UPI001901BF46|nr:uncharacterized protein EAF02_010436 [Botrytis sinoallii]KAF7862887.1 hypothetical protein EAF02_010436 [Botrytis sinoallii]
MSLKNWPDENYPGCDVYLPECKTCILQYWIYLCGCIQFTCPDVPNIRVRGSCWTCHQYLPSDEHPEPTTKPKIESYIKSTTCGKKECVETSGLPNCRKCATVIIIYKCAYLKVKKSRHWCEGCHSSKSKYRSSQPELLLVPHNENPDGMVCENYSDHEERRKKRKELISQKIVPDFSNSQSFQPESHRQLNPDYPKVRDATFKRPTVTIQRGPTLPPHHDHQYTYPRERESKTKYAHTPVMTSTHESTTSTYGGYGYAGGYPQRQPNPHYVPVPGYVIPRAWDQSLQPLILEENPQRYADWRNERKREEARFSRAADRISTEDAAPYESTLPRENVRPREHRKSTR